MANDSWNEETTLIVNAAFKDEDGQPVEPSAARFVVHDVSTGAVVVDWTTLALVPDETDIDIELTPDQMAMVRATKTMEAHRLTVVFDYGEGRKGSAEYFFDVHNLGALPEP